MVPLIIKNRGSREALGKELMSLFEVSVSKTDAPSSERLRHTESQLIYHPSCLLAMESHLVFQTGTLY